MKQYCPLWPMKLYLGLLVHKQVEKLATEIILLQHNPLVGDARGNAARLAALIGQYAVLSRSVLVVTSELYISGYPPEDLLLRHDFLDSCTKALQDLALLTAGTSVQLLVGAPRKEAGLCYNSAFLLADGKIQQYIDKTHLPNYGVFDEKRLFVAGCHIHPMDIGGVLVGVMICEDMWQADVAAALKDRGAQFLLVLNASPYEQDKQTERLDKARARVTETGLALCYVNQIGGQDDLVFDGGSFALNSAGEMIARGEFFAPSILELQANGAGVLSSSTPYLAVHPAREELDYTALMMGLRDYVEKNHFAGVVLGLSGGIDSALAAILAVDALGAERVRALMLPSDFTSDESLEDAAEIAKRSGIRLQQCPIMPAMTVMENSLLPVMGAVRGLTHENLQSRLRGILLMAVSNATGWMVLSTGNKSEYAMGYATLYGDMCGGFAVLKDLYKIRLYELARWRNLYVPPSSLCPQLSLIPDNCLSRAPTAELAPGQKDEDSLPPYPVLDAILEGLIEGRCSVSDMVNKGFAAPLVQEVWKKLLRAEYKRRQAPPGVKITRQAFERERRIPMTQGFL
ncbi:MAG: NAD+ synthase [Alphaproteobacteria bacterium]